MSTPSSRSFSPRWLIALAALLLAVSVGGFFLIRALLPGGTAQTTPVPIPLDTGGETETGGAPAAAGEEFRMSLRLSEGQAQPELIASRPVADGAPLTPEEIAAILARLPELSTEGADQVDFLLPEELLPPPRPGITVSEDFPPAAPPDDAAAPPVESGPLHVLRYSPEGEIPVAPFVNITFNQAMVPLGTLQDLAALGVPVTIEPELPGTWRWLGVKTLSFEYDSTLIDRLPKATEYRVTVPAGVKSISGGELAETVSWTFSTPPPVLTSWHPSSYYPQPLEPVFFAAFDQRVDPAAVLETIQVTADGRTVAVRLATAEEIEQDAGASQQTKYALEGRWLAFRALEPLPADASIVVSIGPGTPSAEGPRLTETAQSFSFNTYAPLRITDWGCSWYDECRPLTPLTINFNNPIDAQAYTEAMLTVEPAIPGVSVNIYGNTIEIRGATQGQTTYTVWVSGDLRDTFGQTLGRERKLTFDIGQAQPILTGPDQTFVTIDPAAEKPLFSVYAINYPRLDLKVYAVQPADWPDFNRYLNEWAWNDNPPSLPGRLVADKTIPVEAATDALTQVDIDLSEYMDGKFGHFIVVVSPPVSLLDDKNDLYWTTVFAWVQVTQIGLDAFADHSEMIAWATALKDGAPLAGVTIRGEHGSEYVTGDDGIARFAIPSGSSYLTAQQGADTAMLPRSTYYWGSATWDQYSMVDSLRWYVFDDRAMYQPGEEVHIKGWMRRIGNLQNGDVGLVGSGAISVFYQVTDAQGNQIGSGQAPVNALGGFDFAFTLPEQVNLGGASVTLTAQGDVGAVDNYTRYHYFQIQEFRRPEFEVSARNETSGPYFVGEHATLAVEAKYYAGGALPNAEVSWNVTFSPGSYSPPNWPEFTFGMWQPWWWYYYEYDYGYPGGDGTTEYFAGLTDAAGIHYLRLDFDESSTPSAANPRPYSVLASASVMDVNRQAWASSTSLLVHPADLYVGLRSDRYFVERGEPLKVDVIVTDLDGNPVSDRPVQVRAARLEWTTRGGNWSEEEVDVQECNLGSTFEAQTCTFETTIGGSYRITARVTDSQGRQNQSQITRWVSGGEQPPARNVEQESVTLIPDKQTYQPGDVAQILVQSPFSPAEGLLTVIRNGILYTERFSLAEGTYTLQIPIEDAHIPGIEIQVDLSGSAPRLSDDGEPLENTPPRPAYATGRLSLSIPPLSRALSVDVAPLTAALEPGAETAVAVTVRDANGLPVENAELAVVVVDEAILALSNYALSDPLATFYTLGNNYFDSVYLRASIVLVDPLSLAQDAEGRAADMALQTVEVEKSVVVEEAMELPAAMAPSPTATAGAPGEAAGAAPIALRTDFNPLATFAPAVATDANGQATIAVKLPDNLTRYRIMVVAVAGEKQFGSGESNLTARLPLMVRPSAPRFLNFGDRFELPVVLQNQTDEALTVDVVARASNLLLTESAGLRVIVPANDRVEVRFPAATDMAGTARVQFAAVSGEYADAAVVELPVYTPATTEAFATYGVVDDGAVAQPVLAPANVFPQYGGLEINTSSTALQALTDAVLYLVAYPFECTEQLSSRILAVAALRDVLTAFEAEGLPSPEAMQAAVQRDIDRLQALQNYDGGFPYWRRGFESAPFNTIHVTHALARAQQKGFSVPAEMQMNALAYLKNIENYYPYWYGEYTRRTLSAYALYVRNLSGDRDAQKALDLINDAGLENLSLEAIGWLWPVVDDESQLEAIRRHVNNRVVETAGAANFTTYYDDQTYLLLSSDRRTDAILLDALIEDDPQSDLIPKLVNGLLAHRTRGRWGNTQENIFVLLALDRYFNTYESQTPDFVAQIWLGETYAGSHEYRGRTTERHETVIPMAYLVDPALGGGETQDLILNKDGVGRLYYRLGLRYAPTDLNLPPADMGFVVSRRYEAVDDPDDVSQDENGVWRIKAGARVRVRVTMVADNRRYHVALVDPLPAGLEIVNPALAVAQDAPQDPNNRTYGWWWWGWTWYEHQNLRDERAEAFATLLWDGVYEYSYIARATTPGTFVAPPAKAEEMYSPEVFGRSSSDWVVVEDR